MTPEEKQAAGFLGLCMRAGQVTSGLEACTAQIRSGGAAIVLADDLISANSRKRLTDACGFHGVPLYFFESGIVGHAIGKDNRDVISIKPGGMADKLLSILNHEHRH